MACSTQAPLATTAAVATPRHEMHAHAWGAMRTLAVGGTRCCCEEAAASDLSSRTPLVTAHTPKGAVWLGRPQLEAWQGLGPADTRPASPCTPDAHSVCSLMAAHSTTRRGAFIQHSRPPAPVWCTSRRCKQTHAPPMVPPSATPPKRCGPQAASQTLSNRFDLPPASRKPTTAESPGQPRALFVSRHSC